MPRQNDTTVEIIHTLLEADVLIGRGQTVAQATHSAFEQSRRARQIGSSLQLREGEENIPEFRAGACGGRDRSIDPAPT